MPCIWGQHNSSQLFCPVAILPVNAQFAQHGGFYAGPSHTANALIDTGATTTGLTTSLIAKLNMQPVGKIPIHGAGGVQHHNANLFYVGFVFLFPPGAALPSNLPPLQPGQQPMQLHVLQKVIQGCEIHAANAPFEVLLGMDVISTGSLVVQGNGSFSFSF
jgi:hypothetical protein